MNSIFGIFMESWILQVSYKVSEARGFTYFARDPSIPDSMNIPKIELLLIFTFHYKYVKYKKYF